MEDLQRWRERLRKAGPALPFICGGFLGLVFVILFQCKSCNTVLGFLKSEAFIAVVGGGIGSAFAAFFGARGAQAIIERTRQQEDLVQAIRICNTAITLAFSICNSFLTMKRQLVRPLQQHDEAQLANFVAHRKALARGETPPPLEFIADFKSFSFPSVPINRLIELIFSEVKPGIRPLSVAPALAQTAEGVSVAAERRNRLMAEYKASGLGENINMLLAVYFGLRQPNGRVDTDYRDSVTAIWRQTDDGIFFSRLLADDLIDHGRKLRDRFLERFGTGGAPNIVEIDFNVPENVGLMPDPAPYQSWFTSFVERPPAGGEKT